MAKGSDAVKPTFALHPAGSITGAQLAKLYDLRPTDQFFVWSPAEADRRKNGFIVHLFCLEDPSGYEGWKKKLTRL